MAKSPEEEGRKVEIADAAPKGQERVRADAAKEVRVALKTLGILA